MAYPEAEETWFLNTQHLGRRVEVFQSLDSTNRLGLDLARHPRQHGLVLVAREQTAGRGQHGRTWSAPANSSVLMSVLLCPPLRLQRPALLTAWAAVAVCELIQHLAHLPARIKWPNDVFLEGKKVCGILIEQRADGQGQLATVVGIGLNVNQPADFFATANLPLATSLAVATGQEWDIDQLIRQLVHELDDAYNQICTGDLTPLQSCWQWRLELLGRQVKVEACDRLLSGRLLAATFDGLELGLDDGSSVLLSPEIVRHLELLG